MWQVGKDKKDQGDMIKELKSSVIKWLVHKCASNVLKCSYILNKVTFYTDVYVKKNVHPSCLISQVESMTLVPGRDQQCPLAALAAGESMYLLDPREEEPLMLHSVYGHPVTCLDASESHVAFGVKRTGWAMHDGGNKVGSASVYSSHRKWTHRF